MSCRLMVSYVALFHLMLAFLLEGNENKAGAAAAPILM